MPDDSHVPKKPQPLTIRAAAAAAPTVLPTVAAPDLTPRPAFAPHLSYTQLAMFLRCSKQYYFRYVVGLKEPPKVSLSIGKGGHAALEWNTKRKLRTGLDAPADEIVSKASDMMDHYMSEMPPSEYEKDAEPGALKDKQLAATRIYAVRDAPKILPLAAEAEFDLDINPYVPEPLAQTLTGPLRPIVLKVDLLRTDTDARIVNHEGLAAVSVDDYKYVSRKKNQFEVDISPQLTTYAAGFFASTGLWPTKVGFQMMHPGSLAKRPKPDDPGPDSIPLYRAADKMTPEALRRRMTRLTYQFAQAEEDIRAGRFIPVDDPVTCGWCGYRTRCQDSLVDDFEAAQIRKLTLDPAA